MTLHRRYDFRFDSLGAILALVLFFVALFFIARGIFFVLSYLAPVLLLGTVLLDYRTLTGFGKWLWGLLQRNPLLGVLAVLLTVVGFPVVCAVLFGKAYLNRKVRKMEEEMEAARGEYIEFEEVEEEEDIRIQLPPKPEPKPRPDDDYERLFED